MKRFILILLFIIPASLYSQDQVVSDSLLVKLKYAEEDSAKVSILIDLSKYYHKTDLEKSLDYSMKSLEIANESGNKYSTAKSYTEVGTAYIFIGNYEEALKNFLMGLDIFALLDEPSEEVVIYNNLGCLYDRIGNYEKALDSYFKALNIYNDQKAQNKSLEAFGEIHSLYNNIGNIYEVKNDDKNAQQYYMKGLGIALEVGDYAGQGVILNNLGKLFVKLERFDEAKVYLQKSLEAREKIDDIAGLSKTYNGFSNYYYKIRDYDKALSTADKSLQLAKEVGSYEHQMSASQLLYIIYEETDNFEKAFYTLKSYKAISDSLMNEQVVRELTQIQMQYEFDKKEKIQEADHKRKFMLYTLIISVLILGFVIIALLYWGVRNREQKNELIRKNLEQDLDLKNRELTTNVLYLIKKNDLINDISKRLLKLKSRMKEENMEPVQKIIFDLHCGVEQEVWKDFEMRFQQIHTDFYINLQNKFPDLSPGEIKLAAFLRLNMTTKEIASITGQSVKSLEVARYRLRKKLNISKKEINLINFLCEI